MPPYKKMGYILAFSVANVIHAEMLTQTTLHHIGDYYGGGIIFYLNKDASIKPGRHGLIAALNDVDVHLLPLVSAETNTAVTHQALFSGLENTTSMLHAAALTSTVAPALAAIKTYSTRDNCSNCSAWYLPSKNELMVMYTQKQIIDDASQLKGGKPFINSGYWSSTTLGSRYAWSIHFDAAVMGVMAKPLATEYRVRAIRAF